MLASPTPAAITKGPWVQRVTPTSAVIRVELDAPAPLTVEFGGGGPTLGAGSDASVADGGAKGSRAPIEVREAKALHSVLVTGLTPAMRYTYGVRAQGATRLASFTTAPADDSNAPFRFLVYGDNRTDDAAHAAVVRAMTPVAADFLVHTGDFVEDGSSAANWQTFFDVEAPLMRERCIFSCVGNHELMDGAGLNYIRYFGPTDAPPAPASVMLRDKDAVAPPVPEHLDGTYRWSNTRFFFINGMVGYRSGVDRAWLEKALSDSDREPGLVWRIVVVHFGPWSSGPHGNSGLLHEAGIPQVLRAHHVDLVIAGHDHIYERGFADGLAYVVSGGGGAPTYRVRSQLPTTRKLESVRHFIEVAVSQAAMQFVAMRVDGTTIERCALRKEKGWDCDAAAPAPAEASSSKPAPPAAAPASASPAPEAPPTSRCTCDVAGARTRTPFAELVTALGLAVAAGARRRARVRYCSHASR